MLHAASQPRDRTRLSQVFVGWIVSDLRRSASRTHRARRTSISRQRTEQRWRPPQTTKAPHVWRAGLLGKVVKRKIGTLLCRPGNDLLSRVLGRSTIGAGAFHGRVRNGIGCSHPAIITRSAKQCLKFWICDNARMSSVNESVQADRAISTGKLHASPRFHTLPINVVVFHDSQGRTRFEVGFPLRCLQRLSVPHIATLLCGWRHNRSTRGASIPVLSY